MLAIELEVVGMAPPDVARRVAEAVGARVRVRRLAEADYAGGGRPVFARVAGAVADPGALARTLAAICGRPADEVFVTLEATAAFARVSGGAPWEARVGYCRAVRAGSLVFVTGTAPVADDGGTFAPGDARAQADRCLFLVERALRAFGLDRRNIARTRMFVTDIARWEAFGDAHREFFGDGRPATTMVEVARLIAPDMLVEIEADAVG
jgi:isochorismate pyruvate lyase